MQDDPFEDSYGEPDVAVDMSVVKRKSFPMPPITVEEAVICLEYIDHNCKNSAVSSLFVLQVYPYNLYYRCTLIICTTGVPLLFALQMYPYYLYCRCTLIICTTGVPLLFVLQVYPYHLYYRCTLIICTTGVPLF